MKFVLINRRFAIIILFVIICISSAVYFAAIPFSGISAGNFNDYNQKVKLTLIIDPGHGGADGGSVSKNGTVESGINLSIALKLESLCVFLGINPVLTRDTEEISYPDDADTIRAKKTADQKARLNLINSAPNAVLISIHQNCFPSSSPYGSQVLYAPTAGSREFGEYIQDCMVQQLIVNNKRSAALIPENIYLMNNIECPAVLVECGLLSNPEEEQLLLSDGYQMKIAVILASSYINNLNMLSALYGG